MKEDLGKYRSAWDFADFDCSVESAVSAVQSIKNATADLEWLVTAKNEEHWVDTSKRQPLWDARLCTCSQTERLLTCPLLTYPTDGDRYPSCKEEL